MIIEHIPVLDLICVTERAAIAAARMRGRGDKEAADQAAVDVMRHALNCLPIDGRIVIGEGERDEAPMLYIGEKVGTTRGPKVDIALDPLEGTSLCAKSLPNSLSVIALAEDGGLLHAPDVYMDKIAIGPDYPDNLVDLDADPRDNICALAQAKGVHGSAITVCILDRPRHADMIEAVRSSGAAVRLIPDGDVAGVIHAANPLETGIDIYMGIGGAPEGVLTAAALRCLGGQMQGRLILDTPEKINRAASMGIVIPGYKYDLKEMAKGEVLFAATGVTDGDLLQGVRFSGDNIFTETIIMFSTSESLRWVRAQHRSSDIISSG